MLHLAIMFILTTYVDMQISQMGICGVLCWRKTPLCVEPGKEGVEKMICMILERHGEISGGHAVGMQVWDRARKVTFGIFIPKRLSRTRSLGAGRKKIVRTK